MLTPKYRLQDYGGTLVTLAAVIFIAARKGWGRVALPRSRGRLVGVALAAPCLTVAAFVFDLFQGYASGEFPYWADSLAISPMGVPALLVVFLVWSGGHLMFLRTPYQSVPLVLATSRESSWWLLSMSALAVLLLVFFVTISQYWKAILGFVWFYLYISLAVARRAAKAVAEEGR